MSNFETVVERMEEAAVVRGRGYLSGRSGEALEREIDGLLAEGRRVVLNFRETDLVNSVGVSILIGIIERFHEAGLGLCFSEMTPVNEEIFSLMGLGEHVPFARSDTEALSVARRRAGGE